MRTVLLDGVTGVPELISALTAALERTGPAVLPLPATDPRLAELRQAMAPDEPVEPGTAVVVTTSGTTGAPKGVVLSAAALTASANATHARLGGPGRWLLALPAQHIGGLQVIVRSLLAGGPPAVAARGAQAFAAAAANVRYTALVPTQLGRLLDDPDGRAALRGLDAIVLGGAAAPAPLLARARAERVNVITAYGMSETASGCVYDGFPLDGVGVRIGAGGVIELCGPVLATGYRRDPEATAKAFASGWFRTTDLGTVRADGALEVLGRADLVINTGGVKVSPTAVEAVLTAQAGVAEACVVDLPDAEWGQLVAAAIVPIDPAEPPRADELRAAVRSRLGGPAVPKLMRFSGLLPVRGPGKVDRDAVRELLREPDAAT